MKPRFFPRLKLEGTQRSSLEQARGRIVLISGLFVLAYILVVARVFDLAVIQGSLQRWSGNTETTAAPDGNASPVPRADITDRNGVLLATSLQTASLYADPPAIHDADLLASRLHQILPDLPTAELVTRLHRASHFIWLRRNLTPAQQYQVLQLGEPGLKFQTEMRRLYPEGPLAAHIVGYTDVDGHGLAGVERHFDKQLRTDGDTALKLTLDIRLQHILRRETLDTINTFSAKAGAGVILDVHTGQVLAAVSLPDFDPNDLSKSNANAIFNRLTLGTYELGSTFKIFTLASLIENVDPPMGRQYDARAPLKIGKFKIADFDPEGRMLTVPEVFMYSSNIGAARMAVDVGTDRMKKFYADLGLLSPLKLEIDEIGRPQYPRFWQQINTMTAAFGHGIAVTPLQLVAAASTIAGGGLVVHPTLLVDAPASAPGKPPVRVIADATVKRMRQLLRLVVTDGTGTKANVPGYNVGGKTGTAEKVGEFGGYAKKRMLSSFLAFFPVEDPHYAVYIMIDEPHGIPKTGGFATGGMVAAPAVARVIASMAAVLGIPPDHYARDLTAPLRPYLLKASKGGNGTSY